MATHFTADACAHLEVGPLCCKQAAFRAEHVAPCTQRLTTCESKDLQAVVAHLQSRLTIVSDLDGVWHQSLLLEVCVGPPLLLAQNRALQARTVCTAYKCKRHTLSA